MTIKSAVIFELVPEAKAKSNEELREDIKLQLDKQIQPMMPWMKKIIEVIVWNEP
ncbi:MAG: hypothetical protein NWE85_01335 [Candidatus Bathyarchaeota archaeon]|nr:hypothetical protein [Candidatus Bathyarchaeota archaeon]